MASGTDGSGLVKMMKTILDGMCLVFSPVAPFNPISIRSPTAALKAFKTTSHINGEVVERIGGGTGSDSLHS